MKEKEKSKKRSSDLWLRISTIEGVVYEKYVDLLQVKNKDGVMVINRNYSSVMEQLQDGEIVVHEKSKKIVINALDSWLTVANNRCNIYSSKADIIS